MARGLDPRSLRTGTKRRSSTSATKTTREHDHGIARSPPRMRKSEARVRSRAPLTPLSGIGSATDRPKPVCRIAAEGPRRALHQVRAAPSAPKTRSRSHAPPSERRSPAEVSRARGQTRPKPRPAVVTGQLALPAPPGSGCLAAGRRRERYPNPLRSDTSRRETVASPSGEAGACQAKLPRERCRLRSHRASPLPPRRVGAHGPAPCVAYARRRLREASLTRGVAYAKSRLRGHTWGQGRIARSSAKKTGVRCTRGAFHRRTGLPSNAVETAPDGDPSGTSPPDDRGFSTGCRQPVENARRLLRSLWIHHP
jgi:hypothetical protein